MGDMKRISVVVPNYNYAKYLDKRIDSIIRQTYPIYELIILDDGSTDGSRAVIEKKIVEIHQKYPTLNARFVKNEENTGKVMVQWKKGFELARGDYVWIAEADDLSSRYFLEKIMRGFEEPGVVMAYCESMIIDGRGFMILPNFRRSRDRERTGHYKKTYVNEGEVEIQEILAIRCTIPNVSAVVFKNNKKYLRYLDEAISYNQAGDWYFYIRILENGKIFYERKALNRFRIHKHSKTSMSKKNETAYNEVCKMHRWILKNHQIPEDVKKKMEWEEKRLMGKYGGKK